MLSFVGDTHLVRLRNPWGKGEWNGPWSERSWEWDSLSDRDKELLSARVRNEGEFWMAFDDFARQFSHLDLVTMTHDHVVAVAGGKRKNLLSMKGSHRPRRLDERVRAPQQEAMEGSSGQEEMEVRIQRRRIASIHRWVHFVLLHTPVLRCTGCGQKDLFYHWKWCTGCMKYLLQTKSFIQLFTNKEFSFTLANGKSRSQKPRREQTV